MALKKMGKLSLYWFLTQQDRLRSDVPVGGVVKGWIDYFGPDPKGKQVFDH